MNIFSQSPLRQSTESGIQSKEIVIDLPGAFKRPTITNAKNQYSKMTFLLISNLCNEHSTKNKNYLAYSNKKEITSSCMMLFRNRRFHWHFNRNFQLVLHLKIKNINSFWNSYFIKVASFSVIVIQFEHFSVMMLSKVFNPLTVNIQYIWHNFMS